MSKYKMIAIDLDDTLLDETLKISQMNYDALEAAHNLGVKIVLCTGRTYESVKQYVDQLGFLEDSDVFVSFNGAVISKVSGEQLFTEVVEQKHLMPIVDLARDYDVTIQAYSMEHLYVENYDDNIRDYEQMSNLKAVVLEDLKVLKTSIKCLLNSNNISQLETIQSILLESFKEDLGVFFSKPNFLEILNINANKGIAVAHLAAHFGIHAEEVIAIGDSFNDAFMIEYAGLGVAVQNAREPVKAIANYVTDKNHHNHAVAEVIQKFVLDPNQ